MNNPTSMSATIIGETELTNYFIKRGGGSNPVLVLHRDIGEFGQKYG